MYGIKKIGVTSGLIFWSFIFCFLAFTTSAPEAQAEPITYDFTYTSTDTVDTGSLGDTLILQSTLKNTGDQTDSYEITLTIDPSTPYYWWVWFCSGGVCHDPGVFKDTVTLSPNGEDLIVPEVAPRKVCGVATVTLTVKSLGNPGLTKSKTFLFYVPTDPQCPVTTPWGLFILISLLLASGFYLILRKLRPVKAT